MARRESKPRPSRIPDQKKGNLAGPSMRAGCRVVVLSHPDPEVDRRTLSLSLSLSRSLVGPFWEFHEQPGLVKLTPFQKSGSSGSCVHGRCHSLETLYKLKVWEPVSHQPAISIGPHHSSTPPHRLSGRVIVGLFSSSFAFPHSTGRGCYILCWNPRLRRFYNTPPPSILPEQLASGSRRASRQRAALQWLPPSVPARAARQWILPSRQWIPPSIPPRAAGQWIPPELLASGSRRVSRQSGSSVDPAEYPARAARRWSIPPDQPASGSRQVSR